MRSIRARLRQARVSPLNRPAGPVLLTIGGLGAAFGAASCCGLPFMLASLGIGSAWLSGVGLFAAPYRPALLALGALGLVGGGYFFWRQTRSATCAPGYVCGRPGFRLSMISALLLGSAFLYLGYAYG